MTRPTDDETIYWPEEGTPEFVSHQDGEDGTWKPLCTRDHAAAELHYRFTPWGSWHCPRCGMTYLIWTEDWPDYDEDECETDGCDGRTDDGEGYMGICGNCADRAEQKEEL